MSVYNIQSLLAAFTDADVISRRYEAGEVIFREGAPTSRIYFVIEGEARALRYLSNGQELVFFRARNGAALAEVGLFMKEHPFTAVASVDSVIASVQRERLREVLRSHPGLADRFFFCVAWRYTEAMMLRELTAVRSSDERLLMWLRWQASLEGNILDFEGRMGSIGSEIGLTRESVYRSLARLEKKGFIKRGRGMVEVIKS